MSLQEVRIPPRFEVNFHALEGIPLYYMNTVTKYNAGLSVFSPKTRERVFIITPDALYLCTSRGDIHRCVSLFRVTELLMSPSEDTGDPFVIKVPTEYDIMLRTPDSTRIIDILKKLHIRRNGGRTELKVTRVTHELSPATAMQHGVNLIRPENYEMTLDAPPNALLGDDAATANIGSFGSSSVRSCPSCTAKISRSVNFCPECGVDVRGMKRKKSLIPPTPNDPHHMAPQTAAASADSCPTCTSLREEIARLREELAHAQTENLALKSHNGRVNL